jgi:DNA repair protein RecO (recombination protein O)
MSGEVGYPRAVALAHVGELLDELMPDREASDAVFRLSLAVLQELRGPVLWMPLTYFELWMTRLMGFLPEFSECVVCGRAFDDRLDGSRAFYHALADGLMCLDDKRVASSELSSESRKIAAQMLRSRVAEFAGIDWPKAVCADLSKFLLQILERHIEKKLVTAGMLEKIST